MQICEDGYSGDHNPYETVEEWEKELTEWTEKYKPIPNHFSKHEDMFETYGEELEFVRSQKDKHIWTLVEGDSGDLYIVDGYHFVNRLNYFITELPYEGKEGEACIPWMIFEDEEEEDE